MATANRILALTALVCAVATAGVSAQCDGFCGANAGNCFCDDLCTSFQDCCADVCDVCNICGDPDNPLSSSCQGNCGQNAGLCWCDALCSSYGDCCEDACTLCTAATGGPSTCDSPSCTPDDCGSATAIGGCFCDALCTSFNDCCADDDGFNVGEGSACDTCGFCDVDEILSCVGFCDQNTGSCWCDVACTMFQDCCEDVTDACGVVVPDGCQGFCGTASTGCFCDSLCTFYNDCCDDFEEHCPCVGSCGSEDVNGCSCAETCTILQNCCEDYDEVCTSAGTCVNFCGGQNAAAGCFCDALCTAYQDCCQDALDLCLSCTAGLCGMNTGACWCDDLCSFYQDCCPNSCDFCSNGCIEDLTCASSEALMTLTIVGDLFPEEISYQLLDVTASVSGVIIAKAGYPGVPVQECLTIGSSYVISILDSFEDGFLPGGYTIEVAGSPLNGDGDIGGSISYQFTVPASGAPSFLQIPTPCQQLLDCNGNCIGFQFADWAGDGICDDGTFGEVLTSDGTIVGINLNCASYPTEAADCQSPLNLNQIANNIGAPDVSFPFNQDTGSTILQNQGPEDVVAELDGADWVTDNLLGTQVIECVKEESDLIFIDDFQYGLNFTLFLAFRHEDSPGSLFEYILSHGTATPDIFSANNFNLYFPETAHPAHGIFRTSIYDKSDSGQNEIYLDSDGQISDNTPRDIPGHINVVDDSWHMLAVRKTHQFGYSVFVDGRKYAELDGTKDIPGPPVIQTQGAAVQNVNPVGKMHLCGRSDQDPNRHFGGFITQFNMFTKPLSDVEILAFTNSLGFAETGCPAGQVMDLCGVCGGSNGNIAPESQSLCCEPVNMPGDLNNDGIFTVLDIVPLANFLLEQGSLTACEEVFANINQDDSLSVTDIIIIANLIAV